MPLASMSRHHNFTITVVCVLTLPTYLRATPCLHITHTSLPHHLQPSLPSLSFFPLSINPAQQHRSGWRNNPALPTGLVYEGLWGNEPQALYGETGAQSAIVPAFDAVLGIKHQEGWCVADLWFTCARLVCVICATLLVVLVPGQSSMCNGVAAAHINICPLAAEPYIHTCSTVALSAHTYNTHAQAAEVPDRYARTHATQPQGLPLRARGRALCEGCIGGSHCC